MLFKTMPGEVAAMDKPYVIDADGHVIEPVGLWAEYTEKRYHHRLPRPVTDATRSTPCC